MKTKPKPPFRRGEWVIDCERLCVVLRCYFVVSDPIGCWWVETDASDFPAIYIRRATARNLRAEAKRLTMRANQLSQAADAVEYVRGHKAARADERRGERGDG